MWATTIAAYAGVIVASHVAGRRARETAEQALAERERVGAGVLASVLPGRRAARAAPVEALAAP